MSEILALVFAGATGVVLGAIFFGGLWLTVSRGLASKQVALWFLLSLLLRTGIVVLGFYWAGHVHWQRLVICLAGFVIARLALTKFLLPSALEKSSHSAQVESHAP